MRSYMDHNLPEMLRALQVLDGFHSLLEREDTIDLRMNLIEVCKLQELLKLFF